jgi:hypothetical protein
LLGAPIRPQGCRVFVDEEWAADDRGIWQLPAFRSKVTGYATDGLRP